MYLYAQYECLIKKPPTPPKKALDPLELVSQMVVSHFEGTENQT